MGTGANTGEDVAHRSTSEENCTKRGLKVG